MQKIRVGVIGVGRGKSFMNPVLQDIGYELCAVCDIWEEGLAKIKEEYPQVQTFTDYDEFLKADFDVVVLANYFHEHAPYAVKAMEAGKHVISETLPAGTMGELCRLVKTVKRTGRLYMLAENYPFVAFNQEMRRLYEAGEIGEAMYAEGEYNHPGTVEWWNKLSPKENHWRYLLPGTYYTTHALAPLMYVTGRTPIGVTGQSISACRDELSRNTFGQRDPGAVMLCKMDNGAVFRIFGISVPGHSVWYRFHGSKGAMENERATGYWGSGKVRVWHESESLEPGQSRERVYFPEWREYGEEAKKTGHSGGDFFVMLDFARALRGEKELEMGILPAAAMTAVAILGWRSCLEGGKYYEIPDFSDENSFAKYENDFLSPFAEGENRIPSSVLPPRVITDEEREFAKNCWER